MRRQKRLAFEQLENRRMLAFNFRLIDASGNHPSPAGPRGMTDTALIRSGYPADYPDGYGDEIYREANGWPNPRDVSNAISAQSDSVLNDRNLSDWIVQWGQFLTHDMDLTSNGPEFNDLFARGTGDFSIPINDPNDILGPNPIPFNRSRYDPTTGDDTIIPDPPGPILDRPNWREQMNEVTAFIDASNVYGSDQVRADALRTFADGKLKTSAHGQLPDYNIVGEENDDPFGMGSGLFLAGDGDG